jgi:hypothetical protein
MNTFTCHCGNKLYFENSVCLACGRKLGFLPDANVLSALEPADGNRFRALSNERLYKPCRNNLEHEVCNWMVADDSASDYCRSCELNEIIPDLTEPKNIRRWYRVERAKRRLLYTLMELGLPIQGRNIDPQSGLAFRFMADDPTYSEFADEIVPGERVMTGHSTGTITINIAEADSSTREERREKMNERYRTLLGHFRHESGHFYWEKLVKNTNWIIEYRKLFGDETRDYQGALQLYYSKGPIADWQTSWISAYASAHPWEDFAETWAHYLHMIDTLETANDFGFSVHGQDALAPTGKGTFNAAYLAGLSLEDLLDDWVRLTDALNALNRSMGLPDAYPFYLSDHVRSKVDMIHRLVQASRT